MRSRFSAYWYAYLPFLEGDGAGAGGSGGTGNDAGNDGGNDDGGDDDATVTMKQSELDTVIKRRVARAVRDADAKAKEEAEKAKLSEAERLKAEKADLEKAIADAKAEARTARVLARAEILASQAGARHDRIEDVIGKADLSEIEVDDKGKVDSAAVTKAIETVLAKYPEWKAEKTGASRSGAEFNGNKRTTADIKPGVDRIRAGYGG